MPPDLHSSLGKVTANAPLGRTQLELTTATYYSSYPGLWVSALALLESPLSPLVLYVLFLGVHWSGCPMLTFYLIVGLNRPETRRHGQAHFGCSQSHQGTVWALLIFMRMPLWGGSKVPSDSMRLHVTNKSCQKVA